TAQAGLYALGSSASASLTILDAPVVTVSSTDSGASELGPDPGTFTITRAGGDPTQELTVSFGVTGSALAGSDYGGVAAGAGSITVEANQLARTITITPVADSRVEGPEDVELALEAQPSLYLLGGSASASVDISDAPVVTVTASDAFASEVGLDSGSFT